MKRFINYPYRVLATGFIVLTLVSILLFWIRFLCSISLTERIPDEIKSRIITPSGLLQQDFQNDPNFQRCSMASVNIRSDSLLPLGITEYLISISPGGHRSHMILFPSEENWAYFDKKSGQFVFRFVETEIMPDSDKLEREVQYYIGPEGISEIPEKTLGRFVEPIIDSSTIGRSLFKSGEFFLYDKKLRRFFKIGLRPKTFVKGPNLDPNDTHEPVQIGLLDKNWFMLELAWSPPEFQLSKVYPDNKERWNPRTQSLKAVPSREAGEYLLVLDKTGRIDLLDKETLTFAAVAGQLPETGSLFGPEGPPTPQNTLSYDVKAIYLGATRTIETVRNNKTSEEEPFHYAGLIAASLSRDGMAPALTVFDKTGRMTERTYRSSRSRWSNPGKIAYFGSPWGPASTIVKYMAESLHPPILNIASFFTASAFEAGAGHRALFLLPNSFVATKARANRGFIFGRAMFALWLMIPGILLALWLVTRIIRDANKLGLPGNIRFFWIITTIAFGLAGYITYRLTRPKITLVTCANCGKPRRPDMDICHRCGCKWDMPELTPPGWRILNESEQILDYSLTKEDLGE